jgi:hypothetical protein
MRVAIGKGPQANHTALSVSKKVPQDVPPLQRFSQQDLCQFYVGYREISQRGR